MKTLKRTIVIALLCIGYCGTTVFGQTISIATTNGCDPSNVVSGTTLAAYEGSTRLFIGGTLSTGKTITSIYWYVTGTPYSSNTSSPIYTSGLYIANVVYSGGSVQNSISITVGTPATVVISGPSVIVPGQSVTYTASIQGATSFHGGWNVNGVSQAFASQSSNFTTTTLSDGASIYVNYITGGSCFSGNSNTITVKTVPAVWLSGNGTTAYSNPAFTNIGIGTSIPTSKLQIQSSNVSYNIINPTSPNGYGEILNLTNSVGRLLITGSYGSAQGKLISEMGINYGIDGNDGVSRYTVIGTKKSPAIQMNAEDGSISIFGENGNGGDWRSPTLQLGVFVSSNGNVGIGTTTTPRTKLDVNGAVIIGATKPTGLTAGTDYMLAVAGKVYAQEIDVTPTTSWADYVFKKDYKLASLEEVAAQIKKEGHLKDVPSAEEVAKNGIKLGEMDATLLRKIEELTLYILAQEKRINQLENKK